MKTTFERTDNMIQKRPFLIALMLTVFLCGLIVFAQGNAVSIYINGLPAASESEPILTKGRTLVPMDGIFEALGGAVSYNEKTNSITMRNHDTEIFMTIGDTKVTVNDEEKVLDVPAEIHDGIVYIPLRAVSENMGATVFWDNIQRCVYIESKVKSAENDFADTLNSYMPQNENYMISPFSVKAALAMLANGAQGESQKEILNVLGIENINAFNAEMQNTIKRFESNENITVNTANSIWINSDNTVQKFSQSYEKLLKDYFSADSQTVTNKDALSKINGWVKEKTHGKIENITESADFSAYLANAVYFNGNWANQFDEQLTKKQDFTDINGKITSIDFMNDTFRMNYFEDDSVQIAELPYKGRKMSMFVMMGKVQIKNPVKTLNAHTLINAKVNLSIPKFKTEFSQELSEILKQMGIKNAFKDLSDLEPMFDQGTAKISEVMHKTYIDVNEHGTEAAAVTGIGMETTAFMPDMTYNFTLSKPFSYIIRDNETNEIIFMGEINLAP